MSGAILVTGTGHTLCDGGNGQNDGAWAGAAREEQPGASESLDRTMKGTGGQGTWEPGSGWVKISLVW